MSDDSTRVTRPIRQPSGEWCRAVLENTRDVVTVLGPDLSVQYQSPALLEVLGYHPEELLGRDALELVHPDDHGQVRESLQELLRDPSRRATLEVRFRHKAGGWRILEVAGRNLLDQPEIHGILVNSRDITLRREAEEQARQLARVEAAREEAEAASRRIRTILESIQDGFVAVDRDWRVTFANRRAAAIGRRGAEELLGRNLLEEFPDSAPEALAHLRRAMEGTPAQYETYYAPFDLWLEVHAYPSPDGLTLYFHDISERKRVEVALRQSEERFRQLADNVGEVFWMFTPDFSRTLYVNPAYERVFGSTVEDLYRDPLNFLEHVHPEDREGLRAGMRRIASEETALEMRVVRPDGEVRWVLARGFPVRDEEGRTVRIAGVTRDVTERERAQLELRRQHSLLESILEGIPDVVFIKDREGRYRHVNSAVTRLLGRGREEIVGADDTELFPPVLADRIRRCDRAVIESGEPLSVEERIPSSEGERNFDVVKVPFHGERGAVDGVIGIARDISERKRMEEALRESEERYRQLFDDAPIPMWLFDAESLRIVEVNQTAVRRYGYSREEFLSLTLFDLRAPEDHAELLAAREHLNRGPGDFHARNVRHLTREGELLIADVFGHRITYNGRRLWMVSIVDVTEQVRVEGELRESEQRFRQLAENIRAVFWMFDANFSRTIYVSPAYDEVWGHSRERVLRNPRCCPDSAVAEDRERLSKAMEEVPEGPRTVQFRIHRPDGEERWLEWRGFPIRNEAGEVYRIAGLTEDITVRKRAEEALRRKSEMVRLLQVAAVAANESRELEDALRTVMEQICRFIRFPVGHVRKLDVARDQPRWVDLWWLRDEARFDGFRRATEALGVEEQESLLGQVRAKREPAWVTDLALAPGYARAAEARAAGLHAGIAFPVMVGQEVAAVMEFFAEETLHPDDLLLEAMSNVGAQLGRVVERRRAEEALRAAKEEAERANRAKSDFLSRMSHELRTPMNAILGFAQVLEMDLAEEEDRESVHQILHAGRHLLRLIDEVLDLARIEAERISLSLEPVRVAGVVRESLDLVRAMAGEREISLRVVNCAFFAQADQQRLKQVLLNLLSNAVKYNRRGGTVTVSCEKVAGSRIRILVADTGPGLTPEQLARVFTPFDRLGAEGSGIPGTGLGLSLSQGLARAMCGELGVHSVPGEGSTFWVELPLADVPESEEESPPSARPAVEAGESRLTILYVEDNLSNLRLIERVLARHPEITLIAAMQGRLGLDLAREHRPDLILLDVHLPDIDGHEVLESLKRTPELRDIPVVVVSADATPRQVQRMMEAGAREYLTKPIDVSRLLSIVQTALDAAEAGP